jgi:hypothetical protein
MKRLRALLIFIFSGGLLIFASPHFIHEAAVKQLPWSVPIIVIPIYALLSYGAFKVYWPRIIEKAEKPNKAIPGSESEAPRR